MFLKILVVAVEKRSVIRERMVTNAKRNYIFENVVPGCDSRIAEMR